MPVQIVSVDPDSAAEKAGINPGESLVSINRHPVEDILDYQFYSTDKKLRLALVSQDGVQRVVTVKKGEYEPLGLEFSTYLIDRERSCKNKCIFCFIDQMPPGLRKSLYFKDDDARLSFLFGNYVTLTNMGQKDIDRIIKMHISPINISVHTTNPALRQKMMANPAAASSLRFLPRLAAAGITMNIQLVLCPGINDGTELVNTLNDLARLYPAVESIAAVPVGLTKYRDGLPEIAPYTPRQAGETVKIIEDFSEKFYKKKGVRLAYPSDEFYIKAGLSLPDADFYGDFNQLENGVGIVSLFRRQIRDAADSVPSRAVNREVSIATGEASAPFLKEETALLMKRYPGLVCRVYAVHNDFFGDQITVAGLVTARDLIAQLKSKPLGEVLLLPRVMLRAEKDRFLDDLTPSDVKNALGVDVKVVEVDGAEFLNDILGE